jgi:hypothetical protein
MSDQSDYIEKAWKVLNLQADTLLKLSQARTETWKVVISAMTAGAAMTAAIVALDHILGFGAHWSGF